MPVQLGHTAGDEVYLIAKHECCIAMKRMSVDCLSCSSYLNANNGTPCACIGSVLNIPARFTLT